MKIRIVSISLIAILFSTIFPSVWIVTAKVANGKEIMIGLQPGQNTTSNDNRTSGDPQIDISGNNTCVVWSDESPGNADIFFTKSTDGGETFSKQVNLSNNIRGSFDPALTISKNHIFVPWDDDSPGNADILFTKSTDRGNSFSIKPINLSKNVGRSLYPDVAISRSNNSYIIWSDDTPGNYEVFLLRNVQ